MDEHFRVCAHEYTYILENRFEFPTATCKQSINGCSPSCFRDLLPVGVRAASVHRPDSPFREHRDALSDVGGPVRVERQSHPAEPRETHLLSNIHLGWLIRSLFRRSEITKIYSTFVRLDSEYLVCRVF